MQILKEKLLILLIKICKMDDEIQSFDDAFDHIEENKRRRDKGEYNSIPFGLEPLDRHVPGIMKGKQYIVTASSGVSSIN